MVAIQSISQMDPQWKDQHLGTDESTTIGKYGCLLTCLTMVANGFGFSETPASLNQKMRQAGGFQGALIMPAVVPKALSGLQYKKYIPCNDYPAPVNEIDMTLAKGLPVIVEVDYSPAQGMQNHWVVIFEKKDDNYLIRDPWPYPPETKEVTLIGRYGFAGKPENIITAAIWIEGGTQPKSPPERPQPKPKKDTGYSVYVSIDGLALRLQPFVSEDNLVKRLPLQLQLYVVEKPEQAKSKIGVEGQWIKVQETQEGYEGYVAAWYVSEKAEPTPLPESKPTPEQKPTPPPVSGTPGGVLYAIVDGLAMRDKPNLDTSRVLKRVPLNAQFAVQEPLTQVDPKLGMQNQWLLVRDIEGDQGYVAAWYVSRFRQEAVGVYPKVGTPVGPTTAPDKLVVRAAEDGLALRKQPVISEATLIKRYSLASEFLVLEPVAQAEGKIGSVNQWFKVRDVEGLEGYIAAWYVTRRPAPPPV